MLPFTLHGYQTSIRTSTRAIPFSLVYGMEAEARFDQLNLIEGKKLAAMSHGRLYQSRVKNAFDKRVCSCKFSERDLVLKKVS